MQQLNKEGAKALRNSSELIEEEIAEIKAKENPTEREKNNMLDLEETRQEILVKIQEIEETQAQVRGIYTSMMTIDYICIISFYRLLQKYAPPWTVISSQ